MKYLCIFLTGIGILASTPGFSQTTMLSFGYNASFEKPETVNRIIDRYNETRTWLSEPMKQIRYIDGAAYALSWVNEIYFLDLSVTRRKTRIFAEGDNGQGLARRDILFKEHTINMGMGLTLIKDGPYVSLGYNIDLGTNKIETRADLVDQIDDVKYEEIMAPITIGSSIYLNLVISKEKGIGLTLRPYYHFGFLKTNYTWFNQEINPNTYMNDTFDQYGNRNHFGLLIMGTVLF